MSALVFLSSSDDVIGHLVRTRGDRAIDLTVIVSDGSGDRAVDGITVIDVGIVPKGRVSAFFDRSVIGRTLVRLSPADGGARLRRRVRRSAAARSALARADVIVACQRDALLTVWTACRRRGESVLGLYGTAAGLAELRRR